jgi:hypothetical protein
MTTQAELNGNRILRKKGDLGRKAVIGFGGRTRDLFESGESGSDLHWDWWMIRDQSARNQWNQKRTV